MKRDRVLLALGLLLFSWWSVYTRYVDLHAFDLVTNMPFRDLSLKQYEETLAGVRPFPYQWRVLAFWLVSAIESVTRLDPHAIDVAIKTLALAGSSALLFLFSATIVGSMGAILATVTCLFVTAAALASEGYAIYFTNDYLVMLEAWRRRAPLDRGRHVRGRPRRADRRVKDDVPGADPSVGVVGHLQAQHPVPCVAIHRDRQGAARQPQGAAFPQRGLVLGLSGLAAQPGSLRHFAGGDPGLLCRDGVDGGIHS